jgi:hypothetical protein
MKYTQENWVRDQLFKEGKISRNQALRRYITRLAARIKNLRYAGLEIQGAHVKTKRGKDYIYHLVK